MIPRLSPLLLSIAAHLVVFGVAYLLWDSLFSGENPALRISREVFEVELITLEELERRQDELIRNRQARENP